MKIEIITQMNSFFILVNAILCFFIAQSFKIIIYFYQTKTWDFSLIFASGGFPSSHSSTVTGLATSVGIAEGFHSTYFAIAAVFAFIVMYDACHVRYYSGKNIELTQQLVKDIQSMLNIQLVEPIYTEDFKTVLGHKLFEVIGGFIIGLIIPFVLQFIC